MQHAMPPDAPLRAAPGLIELANCVMRLKETRRTGWLDRGLDPCHVESVADHSFAVASLAWAAALQRRTEGAELDPDRVLKLAMLHDLAEAITGDSPPYDRGLLPRADDSAARREFLDRRHIRDMTRQAEKRAAEDEAMARLLTGLPPAVQGEFRSLWDELRAGTSAEANFVKQGDRLETFLQSRRYRAASPDLPVESFRREVSETIDDPLLAAMRDDTLRGG